MITEITNFYQVHESVACGKIFMRAFTTMVFDVGKTASPQNVIIAALHFPIKMRHSPLIVDNVLILNEVRCPVGLVTLFQVMGEYF